MLNKEKNIYQAAREETGLTQEKSAELLNISVDSLRAYEGEKRIPPDDVILQMIEIYKVDYLAYQHMKYKSEVGNKYLPNIEIVSLPIAVIKLQKSVLELNKLTESLLAISEDGKISDDEIPCWNGILDKVDKVLEAIISLKFSKKGE